MRVEAGLLAALPSSARAPSLVPLPRAPLVLPFLFVSLSRSLALVCFGSSSAVHVVRVLRLLSVLRCVQHRRRCVRACARTHVADNVNSR